MTVLTALANDDDIFSDDKEKEEGQGDESEKSVVKALEKKYDAMKDKLIMEVIMTFFGFLEMKTEFKDCLFV